MALLALAFAAVAIGTGSGEPQSATFFVSRVADGWVIWHQAH